MPRKKRKEKKGATIGYRDKGGKGQFVPYAEESMKAAKRITRSKEEIKELELKKKGAKKRNYVVKKLPPDTIAMHLHGKPVTIAMLKQWAIEDTIGLYRQRILDESKVPEKYLRALVSSEEEAAAKMGRVLGKKGDVLIRKLPKSYPVLEIEGRVCTLGELERMVKKDREWIKKMLGEKEKIEITDDLPIFKTMDGKVITLGEAEKMMRRGPELNKISNVGVKFMPGFDRLSIHEKRKFMKALLDK